MKISVQKTTSLVLIVCKLDNFCINWKGGCKVYSPSVKDRIYISQEGELCIPRLDANVEALWTYDVVDDRVNGLLAGGWHMGDHFMVHHRQCR